MLTRVLHLLPIGLLALAVSTGCASHTVDKRSNLELTQTQEMSLLVQNRTTESLTLLTADPEVTSPPLQISAGSQSRLRYVLSDQRNLSPSAEHEIVLVTTNSSRYLIQKDLDLILRAAFGTNPPREVRIGIGPCLFEHGHPVDQTVTITAPPLPGVPILRLCP